MKPYVAYMATSCLVLGMRNSWKRSRRENQNTHFI